jgi:hypothetical protein
VIFHHTGPVDGNYGAGRDGGFSGKYQEGTDLNTLIANWSPNLMLPRAYKDIRDMPQKIKGLKYL